MEKIIDQLNKSDLLPDEIEALKQDIETLKEKGLNEKDATIKALTDVISGIDETLDNIYQQRSAFSLNREKTRYEKRTDFAAIESVISEHEENLTTNLKATIKAEEEYLIKKLKKKNVDLTEITVRQSLNNKINKNIRESMLSAAKAGGEDILSIREFKADVGYIVSAADRWIKSRSLAVSGVVSNKLQNDVNILISNAIRSGWPLGEVIARMQDLFLPYVGNENIIVDDAVIEPYRVETIVRTNTTTAFNQGRIVAMRDPDVAEFIHGVQYSAIMDSRTTQICQFLDGRVFKVDDPELDRLTPPNHYNCRSLLVPVMIDEPIDDKDLMGPKDVGTARELAGGGFA